MKRGAWSNREIEALEQMVRDRQTWDEIAATLDRSKASVITKASKFRMTENQPLGNVVERLPEMERGALGMSEEAATGVAKRVLLQLVRGSIDYARSALEDGWSAYRAEHDELPTGPQICDIAISRVVDDVQIVNLLKKNEIFTVGQLLAFPVHELINQPGVGPLRLNVVLNLRDQLAERAKGT